jgi:hypothetical protein
MNYSLLRNFSSKEKAALLRLLIRIAYSDGEWSEEEKSYIKDYLLQNDLKCNGNFIKNAAKEDVDGILSEFDSHKTLDRVKRLSWGFAYRYGIDPDFERTLLNAIDDAVQKLIQKIEFSIKRYIERTLQQPAGHVLS